MKKNTCISTLPDNPIAGCSVDYGNRVESLRIVLNVDGTYELYMDGILQKPKTQYIFSFNERLGKATQ